MVGMEFRTSQLIPPFIIFSGGFYKTFMEKYRNSLNDNKTIVTFTDKHWQKEESTIIWLTSVRQKFPVKVIGICYDYTPSRTNYVLE